MSSSALTAAHIVEAKLDQLHSRLAFLWSAAHSPLAVQTPLIAAAYMRQLRLLSFKHDVSVSSSHTQLSSCSRCCQVNVPGVNATVTVEASKEKRRRQRRREKSRRYAVEHGLVKRTADAKSLSGATAESTTTDSDAPATPRKRKRTPTPATPGSATSAAPTNATASNVGTAHSSHEVVSRCRSCGHADRVSGASSRQRLQMRHSSGDLATIVASAAEAAAQPQIEAAQEVAAKKQRLLQSLQSQSVAPAKLHAALGAGDLLAQAQQRFQLAQQSRMSSGPMAPPAHTPAMSNPFFQSGAGAAAAATNNTTTSKPFSFTASNGRSAATTPAAVSSTPAPFSFSRSSGAAAPSKPIGLLSPAPTTQFSHSASKKPAVTSATKSKSTPVIAAPTLMQGIQIVGGMKSASKTSAAPGKGAAGKSAQKNNNKRY